MRVRVSTVIAAPPATVWADISNIASHVEWMQDAAAIRFTTAQREGVGTSFVCTTRVGPFRLEDRMTVTEWADSEAMGIRHEGLVTGAGRFTLTRKGQGRTWFAWSERLVFPWWMAGPVGAFFARPVLRALWRRNLANLAARFNAR